MKDNFEYQKFNQFFAQCAGGSEEFAMKEIKEFGIKNLKKAYRGFYFETNMEKIYRINLQAKTITRILAPLKIFPCHSTKYLYKISGEIKWDSLIKPNETFFINSTVVNSKINHSKYAAQCLKDAIVDQFNENYNSRPSIDKNNPDVCLNLFINKDKAVISLDTSGMSLHKRGYRIEAGPAPINETLAATILRLSEWQGKTKLYDPFCGSGTFLCEALLSYCRIPTSFKRQKFGFMHLPDFDKDLWTYIYNQSKVNVRGLPKNLIYGSDISKNMIEIAKKNCYSIPFGKQINISCLDFHEIDKLENHTIICNPPYGIRMQDTDSLIPLFKDFGDFLKQRCKNSTAWIYLANKKLISAIGLKPQKKIPLVSGSLEGTLLKIDLY